MLIQRCTALGALLLLLATACATGDSNSCPSGSTLVGNYTLTYTLLATTDACVATLADGGPSDSGVTGTPDPSLLTVCAAPLADAGLELVLGTSGSALTPSTADAGAYVTSDTDPAISDTVCGCAIDAAESVGFVPNTPDGGPFSRLADGGYTAVSSLTGTVDYIFTASATTNGLVCACTLPCGAHYTLSAAP